MGRHVSGEEFTMMRVAETGGGIVSYESYGSGPPLVLVHGSFSDHQSNWELVKPILREHFTVHAVARRGRGETIATEWHKLEDEVGDLLAVIRALPEPVSLLGHSYGAHCALAAARVLPERVRKLVLYEPIWPNVVNAHALARLELLAAVHSWDAFATTFFRDTLGVPVPELDALRVTDMWATILADARASLGDLRAIANYRFRPNQYQNLDIPVLLQVGSESPRDLYVTDALATVLPNVQIQVLHGQSHEGMTTAPEMYAEAVIGFLLERHAEVPVRR
jgi:pimeloyl-ACP methyl ester carboxylesterase